MSLEIRLRNLGIIKQAEFSLGDLTIFCGENNTGKTYVAHTLYNFLESWRELINFPVSKARIQSLLTDGVLKIGLAEYVEKANQVLAETCDRYICSLDPLASRKNRSNRFDFHVQTGAIDIRAKELTHETKFSEDEFFTYSKQKGSEELVVVCENNSEQTRQIDSIFAKGIIRFLISEVIFSTALPRPFHISVERDVIDDLREEVDIDPTQLLEAILEIGQEMDPESPIFQSANPQELLRQADESGILPTIDPADMTSGLTNIVKEKSFITEEHPEVLEEFADIIGGEYTITPNDDLYYTPKGTQLQLDMEHSSSSVRSLADLGLYLHHIAQKGDLLMVDEPELSLHPESQCRIARLFARLVNLGVKVFITTHSDYIVKELNTLIMLNGDKPHLKRIAKENDYRDAELITAAQVKVYTAQEELLPLEEGQKRRRRGHTLVAADIDSEFGIKAPSFDKTIDRMNDILEDIIWGAE